MNDDEGAEGIPLVVRIGFCFAVVWFVAMFAWAWP